MNEGIYGHIIDKDLFFETDICFLPEDPCMSPPVSSIHGLFSRIDDEISISMRKTMAPKRVCPKMDGCTVPQNRNFSGDNDCKPSSSLFKQTH